jgi:hypothetical protein
MVDMFRSECNVKRCASLYLRSRALRPIMRQQESLSSGKRARRLARGVDAVIDSDSDGLRVDKTRGRIIGEAMLNFQASRSRAAAPQRRCGVLLVETARAGHVNKPNAARACSRPSAVPL